VYGHPHIAYYTHGYWAAIGQFFKYVNLPSPEGYELDHRSLTMPGLHTTAVCTGLDTDTQLLHNEGALPAMPIPHPHALYLG